MPPKKNAVDELKSSEIRKLIKAHNKLMSLDIPKGTDREGLIKLVNDNGYKVDHKAKKLVLVQGGGDAMKRKPRVVNMPKEKTEAEKEEMKKKREANKMKKKKAEADLIKKGSILGKIVRKRQDRKGTHKMPDGTVMSGTKHNSKSVVVKSKPKSSPKKKVVKKVKRLYQKEKKTEMNELLSLIKTIENIRDVVFNKRFNLAGLKKTLKERKDFSIMSNELNKIQTDANKEQNKLEKNHNDLIQSFKGTDNEKILRDTADKKMAFEKRLQLIMKNMKKIAKTID
tara:strand:- start:1686 stop:2537 length:852 start_codon:yes stop_codon:yes gene_type:complete